MGPAKVAPVASISPTSVSTSEPLTKGVDDVNKVPTPPGKSWIFFLKIPGPGKSWKLKLKVLESPGKISLKVMHFSSGSNGKQAAIV